MSFKSKLAQQLFKMSDPLVCGDAASCVDIDARDIHDAPQGVMVRAANVLEGYSRLHDVLSDAIENPLSTHDGRLALLPIGKDDYQEVIETLAMLAGMNPSAR